MISHRDTASRTLALALAVVSMAVPAAAAPPPEDDIEIPATPARGATTPTAPLAPPPAAPSAPSAVAPPAPAQPPARDTTADELARLRAQFETLTARLTADEARATTPSPPPPPPPTPPSQPTAGAPLLTTNARPDSGTVLDPVGLVVSGFVQAQYTASQLSEDQLAPDGTPLNRDRFLLRHARLRLDGSWQWVRLVFELDGNTVQGSYVGLHRAEAALLWRNQKPDAPPYAMVSVGLQQIPFGYELPEGVRYRGFMERTLGSQALFPGDSDLGARLAGGIGFFRYALAVMNGSPLVERAGAANTIFTQERDIAGRVGVDTATGKQRGWNLSGGVSFLEGTGFHAGTAPTVGGVIWRDTNENGVVDPGELVGLPPRAATPSQTFTHWAVGADAQLKVKSRLGWSQLYGEVTLASNLDRGYLPSDPTFTGYDVRQLAAYVGLVQEVFGWGLVGCRWDYYNPDADFTDTRRGARVPTSAAVQTVSPMLGVVLFDRVRVLAQYDVIVDSLARTTSGAPTDLANNVWTLRVQGDL